MLTLHSGSTNGTTGNGFTRQRIGPSMSMPINDWTHYAVSMKNDGSNVRVRFYVNGKESTNQTLGTAAIGPLPGKINAHIGSLIANPVGDVYHNSNTTLNKGWGRLTGSMDEFRFWKRKRTSEEIEKNYWYPIGGGQNKKHPDEQKNYLGVYYKFNEGITENDTLDAKVLDYSGRISNGIWNNYPGLSKNPRNIGSAFVSASLLSEEPPDPIIYSSHPSVGALLTEMKNSGSLHDTEKGIYLYDTLPAWIRDEDTHFETNVKKLMQIIASYFDTLYTQVDYINKIKDKRYFEIDNPNFEDRPHIFAKRILEDQGFSVSEIFPNASIYQYFMDKDKSQTKYSMSMEDIKNIIYQNIYNNLEHIYKTKGTEASVRNFIRCFGIDDELLKINLYTDKADHYFRDNVKHTSFKKKYIDFNNPKHFSGSIYQTGSSANNKTYFVGGGSSNDHERAAAFTYEADIIVPYKIKQYQQGYFNTPFTTSSVFGQHCAKATATDYTWASTDFNEFQVHLVREEPNSPNGYFMLTSSYLQVELKTGVYKNIYDNERWNLAVRLKPDSFSYVNGYASSSSPAYTIDFYGVNYNMDVIQNEFHLSKALANSKGLGFARENKRVYAGAHLTNFTGSTLQSTDLQIGGIRVWADYLENDVIKLHALDPSNVGGNTTSYSNSTIFTPSLTSKHIPKYDTAGLIWDFDTVTGSNSSGVFVTEDVTSGSATALYGWIDNLINKENRGKSINLPATSTSMVTPEFIFASKKELPEISFSSNTIHIKGDEETLFIQDDDVSDNFLSIEKSMYQIVSEEMLNTFSSVREFSNLIGKAQSRYSHKYEKLDHLRKIFFKKVQASPDFDKFTEYYKWIDSSISMMISQLLPASLRASEEISNMYESHILERNKYQSKFPLTQRYESTETNLLGGEELRYNWKFAHAPILIQSTNLSQNLLAGATVINVNSTTGFNNSGKLNIGADEVTYTGKNAAQFTGCSGVASAHPLAFLVTQKQTTVNTSLESHNCHWWKDRTERTKGLFGSATGYNKNKEAIRKIVTSEVSATSKNRTKSDNTIYQGSTYAIRKFSKPLRMRIEEQTTLHSGINYDRRKNRNIVHNAVHTHGDTNPAPINVLIAGTGTGDGLEPINDCADILSPIYNSDDSSVIARKQKRHGTLEHGRHYKEEYLGFYSLDTALPFNIYTNPASSGVDSVLAASDGYAASVTFTNLHSDTYGNTNDLGIQGPFTNAWVGGHQHRHIQLNKKNKSSFGLDNEDNRPEAWRVFYQVGNWANDPNAQNDPDIIFGVVGPDYGNPYPDDNRKYATRYREETAKRPLNIKNIKTIRPEFDSSGLYVTSSTGQIMTGSVVQGNYYSNYEVVQAHSRTNNNLYLRKALTSKDVDSQESILISEALANKNSLVYQDKTLLENTTNYSSLYGRRPTRQYNDGNIFLREPKPMGAGYSSTTKYAWSTVASATHAMSIKSLMYQFKSVSGQSSLNNWTFTSWFYLDPEHPIPSGYHVVLAKFGNNDWQGSQINLVRPKGTLSNGQFNIEVVQASQGPYPTIWRTDNKTTPTTGQWIQLTVNYSPYPVLTGEQKPIIYIDGIRQPVKLVNQGVKQHEHLKGLSESWFYMGTPLTGPVYLPVLPDVVTQFPFRGIVAEQSLWYQPRTNASDEPRQFDKFAKRAYNRGFFIDPHVLSDDKKVFWHTFGRHPSDSATITYNLAKTEPTTFLDASKLQSVGSPHPTVVDYLSSSPQLGAPIAVDTSGFHWEHEFDKVDPPTGSYTDSVIVSRFSSPGGPEQMSLGFLDVKGNEYSAYNALPFRNTSVLGNKIRVEPAVKANNWTMTMHGGSGEAEGMSIVSPGGGIRRGLKPSLAQHCMKHGWYNNLSSINNESKDVDLQISSYSREASYHKTHRNTGYKVLSSSAPSTPKFKKMHDNGYVTTPIPRSDFQYSWITSSLGSNYSIHSGKQVIYGHAPKSGETESNYKGTQAEGYIDLDTVKTPGNIQTFDLYPYATPFIIKITDHRGNSETFEFDINFSVAPNNIQVPAIPFGNYNTQPLAAAQYLEKQINLSTLKLVASIGLNKEVVIIKSTSPGHLSPPPTIEIIQAHSQTGTVDYTATFTNGMNAIVPAITFPAASEIIGV